MNKFSVFNFQFSDERLPQSSQRTQNLKTIPCPLSPVPSSLCGRAAERGLVLILVVAVVVLLALMGTVYILSANLDKQTTYAYNTQANLQGATQNVLSILSGVIAYSSTDVNGNTLQIDPSSSATTIARTWDFPEFGSVATLTTSNQGGFFQEFANGASGQNVFTEPWLTADMPWEPNTTYNAGNTVFSSNNSGWHEYICTTNGTTGTTSPANGGAGWAAMPANSNVAIPPLSILTPYLYDPSNGTYDLSYQWTGGPFTSGTLTVPNASVEQPEGSGSATPTPYGTQDAIWNLLPTSDSNGTYYRFATRIVDLNGRLNLNTGYIPGVTSGPANSDPYGEYLTSCPVFLSGVSGSSSDTPTNLSYLQTGNSASPVLPGRQGAAATATVYPSLFTWQQQLWYYEQQGKSNNLNLFSLGDLLGILSYGEYGCNGSYNAQLGTTSFYSRPEQLLPNSLQYNYASAGASIYGTGYEDLYTTYSWDRNYAPVDAGNFANFKDYSANTLFPRMLDLNANIGSNATQCTTLAGEIEQAAVQCGYTQTEATALAVNYLQYRFNKGSTTSVTLGGAPYNCYSVNPTFLTLAGQLYLPWIGSSSTSWTGDAPTEYYVGQAPQPFLNEFEIQVYNSGTVATPNYQVVGWGIELMNPYATPLYLKNWGLYVSTGAATAPAQTIVSDLSSMAKTTGMIGYSVGSNNPLCEVTWTNNADHGSITVGGAALSGTPSTGSPAELSPTPPAAGTVVTIYLTRPCPNAPADGVVPAGNVIVDQMSFTMPSLTPAPSTSLYADVQRDNGNASEATEPEWGCDSTSYFIQSGSAADYGNLGLLNTSETGPTESAVGSNPGMPLYDRMSVGYNATVVPFLSTAAIDGNDDLVNWDDFNCISRETTEISNADISGPLSAQIGTNPKLAFVDNEALSAAFTNEDLQANLYFDFAYDPRASSNAYNMTYTYNVAGNSTGAASTAVQPTILSLMTLVDRASDPTINTSTIASDPTGLPNASLTQLSVSLTRIPGRININTASEPVLLTAFSNVPALYGYANTALQQEMVLDTVAFRQRLAKTTTLPLLQTGGTVNTSTTVPASYTSAVFPGNGGFRSIGDLLVALIPDTIAKGTTPATLQARDAAWADVANFCTVRSDTFAVYGYIQALQINPNYNGGAVTSVNDWYNANLYITGGGQKTIANTTATSTQSEFILVGQERFVAVIDRSESNSTGGAVPSAPRVVALQVLPQ